MDTCFSIGNYQHLYQDYLQSLFLLTFSTLCNYLSCRPLVNTSAYDISHEEILMIITVVW